MKKPTIETLVKRLKRLNAKCDKLTKNRDKIGRKHMWGIIPEVAAASREIDKISGEIMRLERQIINAILAQLP